MLLRRWSRSCASAGCINVVFTIMDTIWVSVAPWLTTWDQNLRALYLATKTRVAPAASTGVKAASWKFEWNAGIVVKKTSSGRMACCQHPYCPLSTKLAWVTSTPFGAEVVPDVNMISTTSPLAWGLTSDSTSDCRATAASKSIDPGESVPSDAWLTYRRGMAYDPSRPS